jgi:hypothetical protein
MRRSSCALSAGRYSTSSRRRRTNCARSMASGVGRRARRSPAPGYATFFITQDFAFMRNGIGAPTRGSPLLIRSRGG